MSLMHALDPRSKRDLVLSESWLLTRHHCGVSYAFPVLVNRHTGEAFSRKEIVEAADEDGGVQPASTLASWLILKLPPELREEARQFLN